jgi:hypothetical protein
MKQLINFKMCFSVCLLLAACSTQEPVAVDYYQPAYRTSPPDTVYSRVMWAHLPHPVKPKAKAHSEYILPSVSFQMPNATFQEAIEALAQSMGYRWKYPRYLAKRRIRIRMDGTVEEVLAEISRQARVRASFDHENRLVRVVERRTKPTLPYRK